MATEMYKLARPMLQGVTVQLLSNQPVGVANRMVCDLLGGLPQFKGEVIVGNPVDPNCRERTAEFLADERLMEPFIFWVYDMRTTENYPLKDRLQMAEWMSGTCGPVVQYVDHDLIENGKQLEDYIQKIIKDNYFPGIVLREPYGTFGTQDEEIPKESLTVQ